MKRRKFMLHEVLGLILFISMIYAVCGLWSIHDTYEKEKNMHRSIMQYKPEPQTAKVAETFILNVTDSHVSEPPEETVVNKDVLDLQIKYPDTAGWIVVPNTDIDYPFVRSGDNAHYLHHDIDGNFVRAGAIFMDYRCSMDMTSQNTIIHGHNMKNGSMFGTLKLFNDKSFFENNSQGTLYLPYFTLDMEFFAYAVVNAETEKEIYKVALSDGYFEYVRENARFFRDIDITSRDKIITLSTCSYEFENARMVLLARIKPF